jgi:DNA-directed RNA polymerase specialized sigma24 family protein
MNSSSVDFSPDAVRAALKRAERDIRLSYTAVFVLAALQALVTGFGLKLADLSDPTHVVVQSALQRLPPASRAVLVLHYMEGLTLAEVAAVLDLPPGTVNRGCPTV